MTYEPALGLRERKKLDTRRALSDAALALVFERGLDNVTREDIAARAGVSPRTFTNYFAGKYEALVYRQTERMLRGAALLRQRPATESLWTAVAETLHEVFAEDMDREGLPTAAQQTEIRSLLGARQTRTALPPDLFDAWCAAIAERTGTDPHRDLYPRLAAGVVGAVLESVAQCYADADPPIAFLPLLLRGFAEVAAGLPQPSAH
ncbi:TetR/AcrR family transcriptional regulator [Nocardia sp. NPDC024068]|uniref:TetR/AcrR family transcriptional regulator n=1 Tax=Nocardia sp. NPDC024068 TaxID=3157197 RepID=UPI0033EDBE21